MVWPEANEKEKTKSEKSSLILTSHGFMKKLKNLDDLLVLGDPRLYQTCKPISQKDLSEVEKWVADLDNVMREIRKKYGFGRAIAAPQVGVMKRLIYMNIDEPVVFINPEFTFLSEDLFEVWDDCMSFPNLLVKVKRHKKAKIKFLDLNWEEQEMELENGLSELLQHEYDHLNGILCTMRALDDKSFKWRK